MKVLRLVKHCEPRIWNPGLRDSQFQNITFFSHLLLKLGHNLVGSSFECLSHFGHPIGRSTYQIISNFSGLLLVVRGCELHHVILVREFDGAQFDLEFVLFVPDYLFVIGHFLCCSL